ncbi:hypothetical protein AX15_001647 [Amanita polypyramis BW_CC]|nr:hypothetical protein AX15_001647 [Amanita polypyramis BW_CC]
MSYVILGRAVKNEYLSLGILTTAFGGAWLATRGGGNKSAAQPQSVEQAKASVSLNASSSEEEEFIKKFIAEAEKEDAHGGAKH